MIIKPAIIAAELRTDGVQCNRVDAGVEEHKTEAYDLGPVPAHVEPAIVEVEPEQVDVPGQPARDEHGDKDEHGNSDSLTTLHAGHHTTG